MKSLKIALLSSIILAAIVLVYSFSLNEKSKNYDYQYIKHNNHVVHLVKVNPKAYELEIVKARIDGNDSESLGRKTVLQIAKNYQAQLAINTGYFEIGKNMDGMPSASLVINGKVLSEKKVLWPKLVIIDNSLKITNLSLEHLLSEYKDKSAKLSLVSGFPILVQDGKINRNLYDQKSGFFTDNHARTAIGLTNDGFIMLAIVEHVYKKDILEVTLGEVDNYLKEDRETIKAKYQKPSSELTITEVRSYLKEKFAPEHDEVGMTMIELANFMKNQGSQIAINMDGGGSSTLVIDGQVVNRTFGDKDEGNGNMLLRPVSDALIFKPISH